MITPCVGICTLKNDKCIGCNRTKEHIIKWRSYTEADKLKIMETLKND